MPYLPLLPALILKYCPLEDSFRVIKPQNSHRRLTGWRKRLNDSSVNAEVIRPRMQPGMEQFDSLRRSRINGSNVGTVKRWQNTHE